MRVLVVGEGAHELGGDDSEGALLKIVRQFLPEGTQIQKEKWSANVPRLHGKGDGIFKRAVQWMRKASDHGYDAVVAVIDQDGDAGRARSLSEAQDYSGVAIPRAIGIAIREFDAWMLADEAALSGALEVPIDRQRDPESDRDPKLTCRRIITEARVAIAQRDFYARVAELLTPDTLAARCPGGFGVFAERLRTLAGQLAEAQQDECA